MVKVLTSRRKGLLRFCGFFWAGTLLSLAPFAFPPSVPAADAPGSAPAGAGVSEAAPPSDLKLLLRTLENPAERDKLIRQLRALVEREERGGQPSAAQKRPPAQNVTFVRVYERLVERLDREVSRMWGKIQSGPALVRAGFEKMQRRDTLLKLGRFAWKVGVSLAVAILLFLFARRLTNRAGDRLTAGRGSGPVRKLLASLGVSILGLIPPSVLLLTLFLVFTILQPTQLGAAIVLTAAWAGFIRAALLALARILFAPDRPSLRLVPLKDETAAYWNLWIRRLTGYGVFGYYFVRILKTAGVPDEGTDILFQMYGAVLVILLLTLILQQRREVRARVGRGPSRRKGEPTLFPVLRKFLVAYWHVIAIAYLIVGYGLWALNYPGMLGLMIEASLFSALLIGGCFVVRHFLELLLRRLFRIPERITAQYPTLEARANRYVRITHRILFFLLYLLTALLILEAWEVPFFDFLFSETGLFVMERLFGIAVVLAIAALVLEAGDFGAEVLMQAKPGPDGTAQEPPARIRTLVPLGKTSLKIAVVVVTALIVMGQIGINITPILAGVGVLGLAVGFGAQSLVKDIISGLFILLEDSMAVGDVVVLKGKGGLVEKITLRTIQIRDLSGNMHVIPHSSVDMLTNMTKDYSRYLLDVGVAYREDTDEVVGILKEIDEEMRADPVYGPDIIEPIHILGVDRFEDSAVIIRARLTTKPIKQWDVGREFNRRMKKAFDERGIQIPFPQRTISFIEEKEGLPTPLYLKQLAEALEQKPD